MKRKKPPSLNKEFHLTLRKWAATWSESVIPNNGCTRSGNVAVIPIGIVPNIHMLVISRMQYEYRACCANNVREITICTLSL